MRWHTWLSVIAAVITIIFALERVSQRTSVTEDDGPHRSSLPVISEPFTLEGRLGSLSPECRHPAGGNASLYLPSRQRRC